MKDAMSDPEVTAQMQADAKLIADLRMRVDDLQQMITEDCCSKTEANQRIFDAQSEAAKVYGPLLADSAFYIRSMVRMLEGHPSRVQLRAMDFVTKKLRPFERVILPMNGDKPA